MEDVIIGDPDSLDARQVAADWQLTRHYTEADYLRALGRAHRATVDLTGAVRSKSRAVRGVQLCTVNTPLLWSGTRRAAALRAYRGGLHLERLYSAGAMRYKAYFFVKDGTERRP